MLRVLSVLLMQAIFGISAFAGPNLADSTMPVLPKGSPRMMVNTTDVIWADSSFSGDIWNAACKIWNPVTGELKPLSIPRDFFINKAEKSTFGFFLLGDESHSYGGQEVVFVPSQGKPFSPISIKLPYGHDANRFIVLADQSALVVGGDVGGNSPGRYTNEVQRVFLENGNLKVEKLPDVPKEVHTGYAVVALSDGRAMILGGTNEEYRGCESCVADTFFLDPKTKAWNKGPRMLEPRANATATLLPDGSVLVVGGWTPGHGWNDKEASRSTERWIPSENRFVADSPLPIGVAGHQARWVAGQQGRHLLLSGGDTSAWRSNQTIVDYEVRTGIWRTVGTSSNIPITGTLIFNNRVYAWRINASTPTENSVILDLPSSIFSDTQNPPRVALPKGANSPKTYRSNIPNDYLLATAASPCCTEKALWLISQGADVNARDSQGSTLLMIASKYFDMNSFQSLIDNGADINARKNDGSNILMLAIETGRTDIVRALLSGNADVNAKDNNGKTALMIALEQDRLDVVQMLLEKNADVNLEANDGTTALMLAAPKGHLDVVQALLAKGADVNAKMGDGKTSLMLASQMGQVEVVRALLAKGADVNASMDDGTNALMLARNGHPDVVQVLLAKGAKANTLNNDHVINIVQLDRYSGTIGKHPVQVALGDTSIEMSGHYHYGRSAKREDDTLVLTGRKNAAGDWELIESIKSHVVNGKAKQSGLWVLSPVADGWKGSWSKMDYTGDLPVSLHRELEAADYAIASYLNNDPNARPASAACTIRVFRHGQLAETIDASNDREDCGGIDISFHHLNSDRHADLIYNIDTSGKNVTYESWRYDATKHRFVDGGASTNP